MTEQKSQVPYDQWFQNSLITGFFLTFALQCATLIWWQPRDINAFWPALAISFTASAALPIATNLLRGKSLERLRNCLLTSLLFWFVMSVFFGSIMAISLNDSYAAVATLKRFEQKDFDLVDDQGTGQISSIQLQKLIAEHEQTANALSRLDAVEATLDKLPVSDASKLLGQGGLLMARTELTVKLLNSETYDRLLVVQRMIGEAGLAQGNTYVVNRHDLTAFKSKLEGKYPLWTWILGRLSLLHTE